MRGLSTIRRHDATRKRRKGWKKHRKGDGKSPKKKRCLLNQSHLHYRSEKGTVKANNSTFYLYKKKTVATEKLIPSTDDDRKIMQPICITSRSPIRMRK